MTRRAVMKNAADLKQIAAAERENLQRLTLRENALRAVLDSPMGRAFVWSELERHRIFRVTATVPGGEIYAEAGRRNAGLELLAELMREHSEQYLQMQGEAIERAATLQSETEALATPARDEGEDATT